MMLVVTTLRSSALPWAWSTLRLARCQHPTLSDMCQRLAGIGIQHFIFSMPNVHDIAPIEMIGREVIPAVADF